MFVELEGINSELDEILNQHVITIHKLSVNINFIEYYYEGIYSQVVKDGPDELLDKRVTIIVCGADFITVTNSYESVKEKVKNCKLLNLN